MDLVKNAKMVKYRSLKIYVQRNANWVRGTIGLDYVRRVAITNLYQNMNSFVNNAQIFISSPLTSKLVKRNNAHLTN